MTFFRREPASLVRPPKNSEEEKAYEEKLKCKTPKATRHLILIRHGQYVMDGATDEERTLTALGKNHNSH